MPRAPSETRQANLQPETARTLRKLLIRWGRRNFKAYPWRSPQEPWHGLIAEVLLQRTRAKNAVAVYISFIRRFPSTRALANASIKNIEQVIYPLGLRWRAPLLKKLGQELENRRGALPLSLEKLTSLPAVGPYAASAWLGFHGGHRAVIVDANVVRLLCRLVDKPYDGETRRKKWLLQLANFITPKRNWRDFNYAILDFTMAICTPKPKCEQCPIGPGICLHGKKILARRQT